MIDEPMPVQAPLVCTMGFVPEELRTTVSIEKASAGVVDWRREARLLEHVSFNDVVFLESPVAASGADEVTGLQAVKRFHIRRETPAQEAVDSPEGHRLTAWKGIRHASSDFSVKNPPRRGKHARSARTSGSITP